ncbi:hypothetical protein VY88_33225 [Azospirillum thiophilum]|uniref:Uncharacterized protein n=1 Tax=Azospirillum thiophilum TaxID=528244 RepID=A0AAC8W629_9PROT|nr:hypothetical protein [Azospirillum thiophilum]ALG75747.1 hypothetical protein AL072_32975 [Azospirillum thiophilum]KJR61196.1 hypothetical protein VY88_33225 [Azospirillum thiophilum]
MSRRTWLISIEDDRALAEVKEAIGAAGIVTGLIRSLRPVYERAHGADVLHPVGRPGSDGLHAYAVAAVDGSAWIRTAAGRAWAGDIVMLANAVDGRGQPVGERLAGADYLLDEGRIDVYLRSRRQDPAERDDVAFAGLVVAAVEAVRSASDKEMSTAEGIRHLAERLGIPTPTLKKWHYGQSAPPKAGRQHTVESLRGVLAQPVDPMRKILDAIASRRPAEPVAPAIKTAAVRLRGNEEDADAWIAEIAASAPVGQGSPSRHVTATIVSALLERLDALEHQPAA